MCFPGEDAAPAAPDTSVSNAEPQVDQGVVEQSQIEKSEPSSKAEAEQAVKDAKTPEEKKEAQKLLKKFKYKADGEEFEEEIDLNNEEELKKRLGLSKVSQKRMAETAELRNKVSTLIEILKSDPRSVLSHPDIGVDIIDFAKKVLAEQEAEDKKSPEQREKEKIEKELKELREKIENEKKEKEKQELEKLQAEQEEKITQDIVSALEEIKIPSSPAAIMKMAQYMAMAMEHGIEVSAKDIAPLVKQQMRKEYTEMLRTAPDDLLEEFIDKDIEMRLQKKRVAKIKKAPETANNVKPTAQTPTKESKKEDKVPINKWLMG